MKSNKRALLIGGTGAIGVYLAPLLLKKGYTVDITTRSGQYQNKSNLRYLVGDGHDIEFIKTALSGAKYDAVIDFMDYSTTEFKNRYRLLLESTKQYVLLSTYRVYADAKILHEKSPRLLDVSTDSDFLSTDDYALRKARQEDILSNSGKHNWTIVRPGITYSKNKFQFGPMEAEIFLWRALKKLPTPFPREMLGKITTMTWAGDVATMMSGLINNEKAYGEDYIVATSEHHTWREVLKIYNKHIPIKIVSVPTEDFLSAIGGNEINYQVHYDRMYDRVIDNTKILNTVDIDQRNLMRLEKGLGREITQFVKNPQFKYTNIEKQLILDQLVGVETIEVKNYDIKRAKAKMRDIRARLRPRTRIRNARSLKRDNRLLYDTLKRIHTARLYRKRIFVFGAPFHENLGDQAQTYCTELLYKRRGYHMVVIDTKSALADDHNVINKVRSIARKNDLIVLHSGYHTTDIWPLENESNVITIKSFPNHHITVLPQTIHFEDEKNLKYTADVFNQHGNITLMCRDEQSFKTAKKHFTNVQLKLMPDIVTMLVGKYNNHYPRNRKDGIMLCFRNDKESLYGNEVENIKSHILELTNRITMADTNISIDRFYLIKHRKPEIEKFLKRIASNKLVITDRYHGTIFSVITNTPVIVLGSTDHKLSSGVKWFSDPRFSNLIYYAKSPKDAVRIARRIYGKHDFATDVPTYFNDKYWDKVNAESD